MKIIKYNKTDFPTGFIAELLRVTLIAAHGDSFNISTTVDSIILTLADTDNETAIRATCIAHFALTPAQRLDAADDNQTDYAMSNGNKDRRFLLELFYQIDKRLRVLESAPAITKQQFINGIKNLYKNA